MADTGVGLIVATDLIGGTTQGMDIDKLTKDELLKHLDARTATRNAAIHQIMGQLARPTRERGALIGQQTSSGEWPKATEQDRSRRVRSGGLTGLGFPITKFARRTGWTYEYLAKATNTELLAGFTDIMNGHMEANYKEALRAIFNDTAWDWSDELFAEDGTIKVMPLVSGNSDFTPPDFNGATFDGTHSHYLNCGDSTLAQDDLLVAANHLREHGFGIDQSAGGFGGQIVFWINSAEQAAVEGHTNYVGANDPKVSDINKIYAAGINSDIYIGYNTVVRAYFRVSPWVPAGYVLGFVTSTLDPQGVNSFAPLARRIPTASALVGIKRFGQVDYPLQDAWWQDFFGFGVANRITAVVLKKAASYTVPNIS